MLLFFSSLALQELGQILSFFPFFFFFILVVKLNPVQSPLLWHCIPTPGTVAPSKPSNRRWNMAASSALCSDSSRDSPEWWCWVSQTCVVENKAAQSTTVKSKRRWHFRLGILHCSIFVLHDQKFEGGFFVVVFVSGIYGWTLISRRFAFLCNFNKQNILSSKKLTTFRNC